jgi:DNA mismatch repair ATPase MutS
LCALQNNLNTILFRQDVLKDCLNNPSPVREIYAVARGAIESEKKDYWGLLSRYPSSILHRSIDVMRMFVTNLKQLKHIADAHGDKFTSEGFRAFFIMLKTELTDEYFATVENHLAELQFRRGVLISGELGKGNKGANYVLRKARARQQKWLARLLEKKPQEYTFSLHPRDDNGPRALEELRGRGINLVANVLAQSTEHILGFFNMLQTELAFYIGCLNLYEQLSQRGEPVCFPLPVATGERRLSFHALYDVCLALSLKEKVVGNDVNADGKNLMIITGANRGGKSTFLRSIGLAQLMMQAGMFVPAESFCSELCSGLFTHYKREEDITMKSGKFAEELGRMSDIVDHITSHSMLLFNESFSATNEREGSEVARQIILALLESHVKIVFVTGDVISSV